MLALRKTRAGRGVDLVRTGFDGPEPGPGEVEVAIRAADVPAFKSSKWIIRGQTRRDFEALFKAGKRVTSFDSD